MSTFFPYTSVQITHTRPPKNLLPKSLHQITAELTETKRKLLRFAYFYAETELVHPVLIFIQINKLHKSPEETQLGGRIICPEVKILRRLFFIRGRKCCCHQHSLLLSCKQLYQGFSTLLSLAGTNTPVLPEVITQLQRGKILSLLTAADCSFHSKSFTLFKTVRYT